VNIAIENKSDFFLPIVELAFSRNYSEEIHQSMYYLLSLDNVNISDELLKKVDNYFSCVMRVMILKSIMLSII